MVRSGSQTAEFLFLGQNISVATAKTKQIAKTPRSTDLLESTLSRLSGQLDRVEAAIRDLSQSGTGPDEREKSEKPCDCARKAAMNYLEGLLWGAVIGAALAAVYFDRSVRMRIRAISA